MRVSLLGIKVPDFSYQSHSRTNLTMDLIQLINQINGLTLVRMELYCSGPQMDFFGNNSVLCCTCFLGFFRYYVNSPGRFGEGPAGVSCLYQTCSAVPVG